MKIEKIANGLYTAKGRAMGHYIAVTGSSILEAIANFKQELAIQRSLLAWSKGYTEKLTIKESLSKYSNKIYA